MKTPIYADLDQIVFEGRSTSYGAYQMRKQYDRILTRAALIAFLMFIGGTAMPKMISWIMPKAEELAIVDETVEIIDVVLDDRDEPIDEPEDIVLPPEPPAPRIEVSTIAYAVAVPTPEDSLFDEGLIASVSDFDSALVGIANIDGDAPGDYDWNNIGDPTKGKGKGDVVVNDPVVKDDPNAFVLLEKEPIPVNMDELKRIIGYPPLAKEGEIEGKVTLRVKVDANGDYVKHVVLRSDHAILLNAVKEKISMLVCTPGIQAGRAIPVWVTIPFNFVLTK